MRKALAVLAVAPALMLGSAAPAHAFGVAGTFYYGPEYVGPSAGNAYTGTTCASVPLGATSFQQHDYVIDWYSATDTNCSGTPAATTSGVTNQPVLLYPRYSVA